MRILLAHNFYKVGGGEDAVFRAEVDLLRARGHDVFTLETHNTNAERDGRIRGALNAFHNFQQAKRVAELVEKEKIAIAHFHNTWLQFSPAVFAAARKAGAATVLSLHNFRLTCANGLLFRDGSPCEDCVGKAWAWRGIAHRCYRHSVTESTLIAGVYGWHRLIGTWNRHIDRYLALNAFSQSIFLRSGLPANKVGVKPNFVADPGSPNEQHRAKHLLFVGRLEDAKGPLLLLQALKLLGKDANPPQLRIVGDGPIRSQIESAAGTFPLGTIQITGWLSSLEVDAELSRAAVLLFPSQVYENFPMTIANAFARGTPVIASDMGAMATIMRCNNSETGGWLVPRSNPEAWAAAMRHIIENPAIARMKGHEARTQYLQLYSPNQGYKNLVAQYDDALRSRWGKRTP